MRFRILLAIAIGLVPMAGMAAPGPTLTLDTVNAAEFKPTPPPRGKARRGKDQAAKGTDPLMLKTQVLLDRAGFSPGAVDARDGENVQKALAAFQQHNGLQPTGTLDADTWAK